MKKEKKPTQDKTREELLKTFDYHKAKAIASTMGYDYEYHCKKMAEILNILNDLEPYDEV